MAFCFKASNLSKRRPGASGETRPLREQSTTWRTPRSTKASKTYRCVLYIYISRYTCRSIYMSMRLYSWCYKHPEGPKAVF